MSSRQSLRCWKLHTLQLYLHRITHSSPCVSVVSRSNRRLSVKFFFHKIPTHSYSLSVWHCQSHLNQSRTRITFFLNQYFLFHHELFQNKMKYLTMHLRVFLNFLTYLLHSLQLFYQTILTFIKYSFYTVNNSFNQRWTYLYSMSLSPEWQSCAVTADENQTFLILLLLEMLLDNKIFIVI